MAVQRVFNTLLILTHCCCIAILIETQTFRHAAAIMTFLLCTTYYCTPAIMRNAASLPSFSHFRPCAPFKGASRPGNFALCCYCCCCLSERRSVVWAVPFFLVYNANLVSRGRTNTDPLQSSRAHVGPVQCLVASYEPRNQPVNGINNA